MSASDIEQWNGEGLPPVGCELEAFADAEWVRAEYLKHHNCEYAVFFIRSRALGWAKNIRPIRSEEDRAVEEMLDICCPAAKCQEDGMRALYRAGYRKTEGDA